MELDIEKCLNVLAGLNAEGQNRLEEAESFAAERLANGDSKPHDALPAIRKKIEDGDVRSCCSECDSWDGLNRRCSCGNRRVCWQWDDQWGWHAEVY